MKRFLATLFSLAYTLAVYATDIDLTGTWKVETEAAGNISVSILTLQQNAMKLNGSIKMPDSQVLSVAGTVAGNKVKWTFVKKWEENPLTITYEGTVDEAGAISGSTVVEPMAIEGAFTAKKQTAK